MVILISTHRTATLETAHVIVFSQNVKQDSARCKIQRYIMLFWLVEENEKKFTCKICIIILIRGFENQV